MYKKRVNKQTYIFQRAHFYTVTLSRRQTTGHKSNINKQYSVIDSRKSFRYKSIIWPDTTKTDERGPKNSYRAFSLTWPASMLIYCNKFIHKKRVQFPQGCLGTPTWPPTCKNALYYYY